MIKILRFLAALVLLALPAQAAEQTIWGATDRAGTATEMRLPVDTSASSSPGYISMTLSGSDILTSSSGGLVTQTLDELVNRAAGGTSVILRGAAGALTTTGTGNIVIGESSDPANTGSENVLIGKSVVQAGGNNSHLVAIGSNITTGTLSEDSVIIGYQATVNVLDAIAIGPQANVSGRHGIALGDDTDAKHGSVAIGMTAQALPPDSGATAVGRQANAMGNYSTAIGHTTRADYDSSTAIGYEATTTAIDQIMLGSAGTSVVLGNGINFTSGSASIPGTISVTGAAAFSSSGTFTAGTGTETFQPCGIIEYNLATETNTGAGEDTLATYTLPANTFNSPGQRIKISAWGSTSNNANAKTLRTYFGSLINTNTLAASLVNEWEVDAIIFRSGSDVQEYLSNTLHDSAATAEIPDREMSTLTEDEDANIVIKITGEATADADIVIEGFSVEYCGG